MTPHEQAVNEAKEIVNDWENSQVGYPINIKITEALESHLVRIGELEQQTDHAKFSCDKQNQELREENTSLKESLKGAVEALKIYAKEDAEKDTPESWKLAQNAIATLKSKFPDLMGEK